MKTEYEATFINIDRVSITTKLKTIGANNARPEFLQRRVTLNLPKEKRNENTWLRVRDEGDKVTVTLKTVEGKTISGQKEILITVDDINQSVLLLEAIGCEKKSYQESKRELWRLEDVEITIDTWPFLEPFVEIEAPSESAVKEVVAKLGLNYGDAIFDTVDAIYKKKYGKTIDDLGKEVSKKFTFAIKNPFQ